MATPINNKIAVVICQGQGEQSLWLAEDPKNNGSDQYKIKTSIPTL